MGSYVIHLAFAKPWNSLSSFPGYLGVPDKRSLRLLEFLSRIPPHRGSSQGVCPLVKPWAALAPQLQEESR